VEVQLTTTDPGFNSIRQSPLLDGEVAIFIDGLPGIDSNRQVFIVHNDHLYTLTFEPWKLTLLIGGMGQRTPLEYPYNIIIQSLRFLPLWICR
jgi:hypothetical protein